MRVLLINSNIKKPPVIPLGLCYVASAIEGEGHKIKVLDLCFSSDPAKKIDQSVKEFNPEVIGVSIRNIDSCSAADQVFHLEDIFQKVIAPVKKAFKGPIVIGGPAVGVSGAEILEYMDLNYAIRGDGELALVEFIRRLENKKSLKGLKGLIIRKDRKIVEENEPWRPKDIDFIHSPEIWRYVDIKPYRSFGSPLQVQTKRGCELNCTYCTYNLIEGKKYRLRNPQKVADEIEILVKKTGIRHIEFTDSTFNIPLGHAKEILQAIIAKDMNLDLRTMGLNPSAVDEELVQLMERAGFINVDFGVEAGSNKMLKSLGKNFRKEDVIRSAEMLHRKGIPVFWFMLLGAPGETPQTLQETFDTLNQAVSPWDFVDIALGVRVYKGSPIARKLQKENPGITTDNFFRPFFYQLEEMEITELYRIIKQEAIRHDNYYISGDMKSINPIFYQITTKVLNIFAPKQPNWRVYILFRKLQRILGITTLKRKLINVSRHGIENPDHVVEGG